MWHGIEQMDGIAVPSEPKSMNARGATDVENYRRRRWKISAQDVLGTIPLQLSTIAKQPLGLLDLPIVIEHLRRK